MFNAIFIQVKKLVVVLLDVDTNEVLERWEFNIEIEGDANEAAKENIAGNSKDKKDTKAGSVREIVLRGPIRGVTIPGLESESDFHHFS